MKTTRPRTSPGEILSEEFLKPNGFSAHALALALRVPANRISGVVNGTRAVTAILTTPKRRDPPVSAKFRP